MQIYAINGSPRKQWNTAQALQHVLDGAAEADSTVLTEMINLYSLNYKGCVSCFECKRLGGPSYGKCAVNDELQPVLRNLAGADIIVFGSPIYFGDITGQMRCFLERFLFQYFQYSPGYPSLAPKKPYTAFLYTMNCSEDAAAQAGYADHLRPMESFIGHCFGHAPEIRYVYDTYQFRDYAKYKCDVFDPQHKAEVRKEQYPLDLRKCKELGAKLVNDIKLTDGLF